MWRRLFAVAVLAVPLLAAGCTVPSHAVAGVGVDAGGRIVGYLRVCSHHVDGATLYHDEKDKLGSWTAPGRVTDFASWALASPPPGWQADPPLARLLPTISYSLYGWTSDNSSSAVSVTFTLEQLAGLRPGQVLHWSGSNSHGDEFRVDSVEEFRRSACSVL